MKRSTHLALWDQMRQRHGITLRLIDQISGAKLTEHPIAGMRTPIELIVHMYAGVRVFPESTLRGKVEKFDDKAAASGIRSKEPLVAFVNEAWAAGDKAAHEVTDAQLASMVSTPWGDSFPGFAMFGIVNDEYLHHRGQLYAFVRAFGVEPVMVWDFEHNAEPFRPATARPA